LYTGIPFTFQRKTVVTSSFQYRRKKKEKNKYNK